MKAPVALRDLFAAASLIALCGVADAAPPSGFEQRVEQLRKDIGVPGVTIATVDVDASLQRRFLLLRDNTAAESHAMRDAFDRVFATVRRAQPDKAGVPPPAPAPPDRRAYHRPAPAPPLAPRSGRNRADWSRNGRCSHVGGIPPRSRAHGCGGRGKTAAARGGC